MNMRLLTRALGLKPKPAKPRHKEKSGFRNGKALTQRVRASGKTYNRAKVHQEIGHKFLRIQTDACCYCGDYATEGDHRPSLFACWKRNKQPCSLIGACAKCNAALGVSGETKPQKLITLAMLRTSETDNWRRKQMIARSAECETMAEWALSEYMQALSATLAKAKHASVATLHLPPREIRLPYKD